MMMMMFSAQTVSGRSMKAKIMIVVGSPTYRTGSSKSSTARQNFYFCSYARGKKQE